MQQTHNAYVYGDTHIHIYMDNKFTFRKREPGQYPPYHFIWAISCALNIISMWPLNKNFLWFLHNDFWKKKKTIAFP